MKIKIPQHIQELRSYKPGKPIAQIIEELELADTAILWNNENNFGASPKALDKVREALETSYLYPDPTSLELRTTIAKRCGRTPDEVIVGNGSEEVLNNVLKAFCSGEDELLTSEGTFVAIYIWAKSNNVPCRKISLTEGYGFDLDAIAEGISDNTKVIYLSNPNNPTGAMISESELNAFLARVPEHILVVVDEAYSEYAVELSDVYPDSTKLKKDNVITLRTFSKAYGIAAMRVGYGIAHHEVIEALSKVKMTFAPSNVAQAAGLGALEDSDFLNKTVQSNKEGIEYLSAVCEDLNLDYVPSFGNFVMIDFKDTERVQELFNQLLKLGAFVRPLTAFGLPHCMRVTVGLPRENALFAAALNSCL